jgi:enoyl-CoA hydratase/carnithine racemase
MTEQVLVTDDSELRIVRRNPPGKENALTQAFSPRPPSAEAAKAAGLINDLVDAAVEEAAMRAARGIAALPAGAVALSRSRLRGDSDDVVKRSDVETMHCKERKQSDETSSAIAAFLSRKI